MVHFGMLPTEGVAGASTLLTGMLLTQPLRPGVHAVPRAPPTSNVSARQQRISPQQTWASAPSAPAMTLAPQRNLQHPRHQLPAYWAIQPHAWHRVHAPQARPACSQLKLSPCMAHLLCSLTKRISKLPFLCHPSCLCSAEIAVCPSDCSRHQSSDLRQIGRCSRDFALGIGIMRVIFDSQGNMAWPEAPVKAHKLDVALVVPLHARPPPVRTKSSCSADSDCTAVKKGGSDGGDSPQSDEVCRTCYAGVAHTSAAPQYGPAFVCRLTACACLSRVSGSRSFFICFIAGQKSARTQRAVLLLDVAADLLCILAQGISRRDPILQVIRPLPEQEIT